MIAQSTIDKETQLEKHLNELGKVAIAFSGGVDSTYLLSVAKSQLQDKAVGVFVRGAMVSKGEEEDAIRIARDLNFPLEVIDIDIFQLKEFVLNPMDRCYFCKKYLFTLLKKWAKPKGYKVIDGTNYSDISEYRPGRKALEELGIISPLLEAEITKEEIRELSRKRDLPTWNKPSMACLASRIPYGDEITPEVLKKIEKAEKFLHTLNFRECRVRNHSNLARIEVPIEKIEDILKVREEINTYFKQIGYKFITLDLLGLRSGSFDIS